MLTTISLVSLREEKKISHAVWIYQDKAADRLSELYTF